MPRKKTPAVRLRTRRAIAERLKQVRVEVYGSRGGPACARRLGIPARTWYNYEKGSAIPAEVLLDFLHHTHANPAWLRDGQGPRRFLVDGMRPAATLTAPELLRLALAKLEAVAS